MNPVEDDWSDAETLTQRWPDSKTVREKAPGSLGMQDWAENLQERVTARLSTAMNALRKHLQVRENQQEKTRANLTLDDMDRRTMEEMFYQHTRKLPPLRDKVT